jgi:hypothetical protein
MDKLKTINRGDYQPRPGYKLAFVTAGSKQEIFKLETAAVCG